MSSPPAPEPRRGAHEERLARWTEESQALRDGTGAPRDPEAAALVRYRRSRTGRVTVTHPLITHQRYRALTRQRRNLLGMIATLLALAPVLVVLGFMVDPLALQAAMLLLLVPSAAGVLWAGRRVAAIGKQRQVTLRGGLADAWRDWVHARSAVEAIDHAAQARAALGANEPRMESLVLALSESGTTPGGEDPEEAAARAWVYGQAAKAVALAAAERAVELQVDRQAGDAALPLAPSGDPDALDRALRAARGSASEGVDGP